MSAELNRHTLMMLTLDSKTLSATSGEITCKSNVRYVFKYCGSLKKFLTVRSISEKTDAKYTLMSVTSKWHLLRIWWFMTLSTIQRSFWRVWCRIWLSSNMNTYYAFGNHLCTFSSVRHMYSLFGRHISFPYLCQWILTFNTPVFLYTILMPINC